MTGLLVDTHVFLWLATDPGRVPRSTRDRLSDEPVLVLSVASAWEISIKYSLGKLPLPQHPAAWLPGRVAAMAMSLLPLSADHVTAVADLPLIHRDPFDRVLVAVAGVEGLHIVTADPHVARYDVDVVWG